MPLGCVLRVFLFRAFSQAFFYQNSSSSSIFLNHFVGLCSSESGFCRAPFQFECLILGLFLWPSSAQHYCYLVVLLCLAFPRAPFILKASFGVFLIHFFYPGPSSSFYDFGVFSVSQGSSLFSVLFGVYYTCVTDCGRVIALVNRW